MNYNISTVALPGSFRDYERPQLRSEGESVYFFRNNTERHGTGG